MGGGRDGMALNSNATGEITSLLKQAGFGEHLASREPSAVLVTWWLAAPPPQALCPPYVISESCLALAGGRGAFGETKSEPPWNGSWWICHGHARLAFPTWNAAVRKSCPRPLPAATAQRQVQGGQVLCPAGVPSPLGPAAHGADLLCKRSG